MPDATKYNRALAEDLRGQPSVQQLLADKPTAATLAPALEREVPGRWRHMVDLLAVAALLTGEAR